MISSNLSLNDVVPLYDYDVRLGSGHGYPFALPKISGYFHQQTKDLKSYQGDCGRSATAACGENPSK
tara:strand:+ start:2589 stop:2789 length:201 start_codon:yes stop_codon:yes gene_type:complete